MTDKYRELARAIPAKVLLEFGVTLDETEESMRLILSDGTHKDHVGKLTGILAVQAELFKYALTLSLALKPPEEGIITLNHMRAQTVTLLNLIADNAVENFVDNNISTKKVEVES